MSLPLIFADVGAKAVTALDPETAHRATIKMLRTGLAPKVRLRTPNLSVNVGGLHFPNPLGLAAGFDKNAEVPDAMLDLGFGFVEVGGVTPRPQPGNPRPRVFRLSADEAVINRYGFNNDGMAMIARRLKRRAPRGIVGVNLGANKDSDDRIQDYVTLIEGLAGLASFFTVNISSPNTPGLRALQDKSALVELLSRVLVARDEHAAETPVFLKIAPDLEDADKADIAHVVRDTAIEGLIVSNTTIARPDDLKSRFASEKGGLSGRPLFAPSTALLREFYQAIGSETPLIGVGGVASARDAYEKIRNGATLVQLYSAMIFEGPSLPARILRELPDLLSADGFSSLEEAVGASAV